MPDGISESLGARGMGDLPLLQLQVENAGTTRLQRDNLLVGLPDICQGIAAVMPLDTRLVPQAPAEGQQELMLP